MGCDRTLKQITQICSLYPGFSSSILTHQIIVQLLLYAFFRMPMVCHVPCFNHIYEIGFPFTIIPCNLIRFYTTRILNYMPLKNWEKINLSNERNWLLYEHLEGRHYRHKHCTLEKSEISDCNLWQARLYCWSLHWRLYKKWMRPLYLWFQLKTKNLNCELL